MKIADLYGRQLLSTEVPTELLQTAKGLTVRSAMKAEGNWVICNRCGSARPKSACALPGGVYYCAECIQLGRVSTTLSLISASEPNKFKKYDNDVLTWDGNLSDIQAQCSKNILTVFQQRKQHLLWAVTGAGKTEMLFEGLDWALGQGLRVAVASPRIDVCNELFPRFVEAFKNTEIQLLHGRNDSPYKYCQFTVCTTHQLLRFYEAFDVLIIDEVDAFPFAQNEGLLYAAKHAKKREGALLFLTATPGESLLKQIKTGRLGISYLPLRYHGHLLPTIKCKTTPSWKSKLKKEKLPNSLIFQIKLRLKKKIRFLLFVPHVEQLKQVQQILHKQLPGEKIVTVHAADEKRIEKVQMMRQNEINFLITTTILERGVTFPGIDVFVLGADDDVFSSAALVQIAGRVGRKIDRPTGDVIFWCGGYSKNVLEAIKQIRYVNRKGLILLKQRSTSDD